MGIREKVFDTLRQAFPVEYMRLEEDDGLIGFVVSTKFQQMPTLDRHELLDRTLAEAFSRDERRQIVIIAPITPDEWGAIGQQIPIQSVTQSNRQTVKVVVEGSQRDADFVRELLERGDLGVSTSEVHAVPGKEGSLVSFTIKSVAAPTLPRRKVIETLRSQRAVEIAPAIR